MKREIPEQLKNELFMFCLIAKNTKFPFEPKWNTENCYKFFEPKLLNHLLKGGNLGVICGYGSLIVIDFDDADYQLQKSNLLPKTFTCKSAGKGLNHFYYILKGDMISKIGIGSDKRLCDIQANKSPITCPPSTINSKSYSVVEDLPIAEIEYETISRIFEINLLKRHLKGEINYEPSPEKVQQSIEMLLSLRVQRKGQNRFACPFHESNGSGNLLVYPDGAIKCFHCERFFNIHTFRRFYEKHKVVI